MKPDEKPASALAPGLYVVATPIGNLQDITLRALRVLKEADLIACEDTRHTQKLLNHYGIATKTISYHEHNEASRAEELVGRLKQGARIALVSDAGMPAISDPGYRVVGAAVEAGIPVVPVPGAAAFVAALAASGLPTDSFEFRGFLPAKRGQRRQALERIKKSESTQAFYEAPHRLKEALEDVAEVLGPHRPVVVARELTKLHEQFLRGPAGDILAKLSEGSEIKGEITLLIGKSEEDTATVGAADSAAVLSIGERMKQLMSQETLDEKAALKKVAKERGISKSDAYRDWQRSK